MDAQTKPIADQNTETSATCIGCKVISPENARDLDNNTSATFDVSPLFLNTVGYISRDYDFGIYLPMTDEIKLKFSFSDQSLLSAIGSSTANAIIFNRIQIELLDGSTVLCTYGGDGLASRLTEVDVINTNTAQFNIIIKLPMSNVNGIRIKTGALAGISTGITPTNLNLYDITSTMADRYYASRFTGNSGQVGTALLNCINCAVTQESLATTYFADPNTEYATYQWDIGLSLLGSEYQYIEYDWGSSPNYNLLGDQDGIPDALTFVLQEVNVIDMGLSDMGMNLWSSRGIEFFITYTDLSSNSYSNNSPFLNTKSIGEGSGRFQVTFNIPLGKTVDKVEVRRVAPTMGMFTELRLYSIFSVVAGTLPLDLLTFDAKKDLNNTSNSKAKTVQLHWTTAQELDVSHFEIERSKDAISFETIAKVFAKNQVFNTYNSTDYYPMLQDNYYRLKMVDIDGTTKYSKIKNAHFEALNIYEVRQYPNELILQTSIPLAQDALVSIISLDGRILHQTIFNKNNTILKINTNSFGNAFQIVLAEQDKHGSSFSKLVHNW